MTAPALSLTSPNPLPLATAAALHTTGGVPAKLSKGLTHPYGLLLVIALGAALQALAVRHARFGVTRLLVLGLEVAGGVLFRESLSPRAGPSTAA